MVLPTLVSGSPQVITQPINIMTLPTCKQKCDPAISWRFVYNFMLTKDNFGVVELITFCKLHAGGIKSVVPFISSSILLQTVPLLCTY